MCSRESSVIVQRGECSWGILLVGGLVLVSIAVDVVRVQRKFGRGWDIDNGR